MDGLFTIGEISELYGINYRTLRYYDDIGILTPEYKNPENGYRFYSTRQFEILNAILYYRGLGIPLNRIKFFLENRSLDKISSMLLEQKNRLDSQISKLERCRAKLCNRLDFLESAKASEYRVIKEKRFGERRMAMVQHSLSMGDDIEYPIREVAGKASGDFIVFLGKVGLSVGREALLAGRYAEYSGLFILLDPEEKYNGSIKTLPAGDYVTLRFQGTHLDAGNYYDQMLDYVRDRGFELTGDALEIAIIDYTLTDAPDVNAVEIQLPICTQ